MNRGLAAAGVAAVLLLTGCSAATQENVAVSSATGSPDAITGSTAPLAAQAPETGAQGNEAAFVEQVRANLRPDNVIPDATDGQLIAAGKKACEALKTRKDGEPISVIDGETPDQFGYFLDSVQIVQAAADNLC